ncbi:hypothetical protein PFISCL1PPCAC_10932, partial [Pristionchus fissidentatus]
CYRGWTGNLCDKIVDYCVNSPCEGDSTCVNRNGSFTCECSVDRIGRRCEYERTQCGSDRECLNGGRCVAGVCECLSAFEGPNCEDKALIDYPTIATSTDQTLLTLSIHIKPSYFIAKIDDFLLSLSRRLGVSVIVHKSFDEKEKRRLDVFEITESGKGRRVDMWKRSDARMERRGRMRRSSAIGVIVVIEVDLVECSAQCMSEADAVAREFEATVGFEAPVSPNADGVIMKDEESGSI